MCARRAEVLFQGLGRVDPVFARWFEHAYSRKHSLGLPFEPTRETFQRFFERRKYRLGREVFTFQAWTGQEQQGRGGMLSFTCGSDDHFYNNGCLLHLPREEPAANRVLTVSVLREVVRAMVLAWEPDGCSVVAERDRAAKKALEDGVPCLGWLTYVSGERGKVPALPRPARVESMEDKGTLIILTKERFSLDNPEHLTLAGRVRERLEKVGLLPPPKEG